MQSSSSASWLAAGKSPCRELTAGFLPSPHSRYKVCDLCINNICLVNINQLNSRQTPPAPEGKNLLAFLMESKDAQRISFPRLHHQLPRKKLPVRLLFFLLWYTISLSKNSDLLFFVNRVIDWNTFCPALPFAFNSTFNTLAAVGLCRTMSHFCSEVFAKILGTAQSSSSEAYWKRNKNACWI